ncbi:hypothetical protein ACHAPO_003373 [Fusarium lateritium]
MAEPDQQTKNGEEIVRKINAGLSPREIDLSVYRCSAIPANKLLPGKSYALSESIVTEIFRETRIPDDLNTECKDAMAEKIMMRDLLQIMRLQAHPNWKSISNKLSQMRALREFTGMPISLSVPDLALVIAAVVFRKIEPKQIWPLKHMKDFFEFFGDFNGMQWLSIAIQVNSRTKGRPFAIELDQRATEPQVRRDVLIKGKMVSIVGAKKPQTNIYEAAMQAVTRQTTKNDASSIYGHNLDIKDEPRKSIEDAESGISTSQQLLGGFRKVEFASAHLEPVPPNVKEQGLDPESQHEEDRETQPDSQLNSDTLRDHARQMKEFGKRLPSPDQKFVRRVRRDIRRFANLADEKENEMALEHSSATSRPSSSSGFGPDTGSSSIDLFGRYKMLWKGSLRENGSIPESLRELVRHDCDPNQIFYLEETESDFLAAKATRNDENGHERQ